MQDQLQETLRQSRRVFTVLTEAFVKDPWCLLQFRLAMAEKLGSPSSRLIGKTKNIVPRLLTSLFIVILHGQPSFKDMPEDIRNFVKKVTHVKTDSVELDEKLR